MTEKQDRPKRRAPTLAAKVSACERRLCQLLGTDRIEYDHRPAIWERPVNAAGTDYDPPQNDPAFIEALSREEHHVRTHGNGATTLGSDAHNRKKQRNLRGENKDRPKRQIPNAGFPKPPEGYKHRWAKRPMGKRKGAA